MDRRHDHVDSIEGHRRTGSAATGLDGRVRVCVVVPVRDDGALLDACLRSLARQTRVADEVIVVDNGSTDDTVEVARRHGARVVTETEVGIAAAASTGYDEAAGVTPATPAAASNPAVRPATVPSPADLIGRVDADSVLPRTWIADLVATLEGDPDVIAVSTNARFYDAPVGVERVLSALYVGAYHLVIGAALAHWPLFGSTMMMRRTAWLDVRDEVHRHETLLHDDMDLALHLGDRQLAGRGRIAYRRDVVTGISARPLAPGNRPWLRTYRALHSFAVHGTDGLPWSRWLRADPAGLFTRLGWAPSPVVHARAAVADGVEPASVGAADAAPGRGGARGPAADVTSHEERQRQPGQQRPEAAGGEVADGVVVAHEDRGVDQGVARPLAHLPQGAGGQAERDRQQD